MHDLGDAAVARRVAALGKGGARLWLAGFFRREPPDDVAGVSPVALGRTEDARLLRRVFTLLGTLLRPARLRARVEGADVVMARNLEMLLIALRVRRRGQRVVYECLDIHRLMLRSDLVGHAMRAIERMALGRVDLVLVSSPAFERDYFRKLQHHDGPVALVENKVASLPEAPSRDAESGGPWTVGWFGMLRCRRSLALLTALARGSGGRIKVLIAGIPSTSEFADLPGEVARSEGVEFAGPYAAADLPHLYGRVHFAWCIDYFEEGLNSRWLLPNRLYESIAHGSVPVALEDVETGRWLAEAGVGLTLAEGGDLARQLETMDAARYRSLAERVAALPRERVGFLDADHRRLVALVQGAPA